MNIAFLEELPPNRLARSAFEANIIRHDDSCTAIDLQQGLDVLVEVELLVRGCG
jgi:hypothetical protein